MYRKNLFQLVALHFIESEREKLQFNNNSITIMGFPFSSLKGANPHVQI